MRKRALTFIIGSSAFFSVFTFQNCGRFSGSSPLSSPLSRSSSSDISNAPDASQLDMQGKNECGTKFSTVTIGGIDHQVFSGPIADGSYRETWHQWIPCLDNLLTLAKTSPVTSDYYPYLYNQIYFILSRPNSEFQSSVDQAKVPLAGVVDEQGHIDLSIYQMPVYPNESGVPYDSMSATDFAYFLLQAHAALVAAGYAQLSPRAAYETNLYLRLALGSNQLVTTAVSAGGLRWQKICEHRSDLKCSFFFAATSETNGATTTGETLNKVLFAVRDLFASAIILDTLASLENADYSPDDLANFSRLSVTYKTGSLEGANQMVYAAQATKSSPVPNLLDFIAVDQSGQGIVDSWAYYTYDSEKLRGDFIHNRRYKNCAYHLQDMELLATIITNLNGQLDPAGFRQKRSGFGNTSVLGFLLKAYEAKIKAGFTDQPPNLPGSNFDACDPQHSHPLSGEVIKFFKAY